MKQEIKERVERIRNGEVPEGYKVTKVGIVPNEWEEKMFNDIVFDFRGGAPLTPNDFKDNGIKVLPKGGVTRGGILVIKKDKMQYCSSQYTENHETNLVDNTYTIIVLRDLVPSGPNIGLMVKIDSNDDFILAQGVYGFKVKDELVSSHFLIHLSNGNGYRKLMNNIMVGSTQVHITNTTFLKLHIPLPSFPEQQKIAEILSTWDKAIELKEKLIEEKKEFKRGLMQKLLVGKIRFKEYVKNPNLQEVRRYSTLPEDWSIKKASSIFSNISKKNNDNEKLLSATQDNGVIPRDMLDGDVMSPSGDTNNYKLVKEGDFVISLRTFQGGIEYSCYRGIISPAYTVIKNKIPICADFYRYIFKSKLFIDRLASSVIGIRDGKQISYGDFSFMFLPYPELKEQEKIAFSLKNLDDNIELFELELNHLKEQKRGIMQLLLTGIVRVEVD